VGRGVISPRSAAARLADAAGLAGVMNGFFLGGGGGGGLLPGGLGPLGPFGGGGLAPGGLGGGGGGLVIAAAIPDSSEILSFVV